MKLILFGYTSFVGQALLKFYKNSRDVDLILVGRKGASQNNFFHFEVDYEANGFREQISEVIQKISPDETSVFFNLISHGSPDYCELNSNESQLINVQFTCDFYRALLGFKFGNFIHFSTNAVYSGNNAPYTEASECHPINAYGRHKLEADRFLLDQNDSRVIVARPITMYGNFPTGGRGNPVGMIIKTLLAGNEVRLVDDLVVNILFVDDLCRFLDRLVAIGFHGLINLSGEESMSRYDLGLCIANTLNLKKDLIKGCSMEDFPAVAPRPLDTSFDTQLLYDLSELRATSIDEVLRTHDYKRFYEL
jgi:dTDP-4-dehydrorhamnose reductase